MSVLEIIIALAILTLSMTQIIQLLFGNMVSATFSEQRREALQIAEEDIERANALSKYNFNSIRTATATAGIFAHTSKVLDITPCIKKISIAITWPTIPNSNQKVKLETLVTSPKEVFRIREPCSGQEVEPQAWVDFTSMDSETIGNYFTDMDVKDGIAYIGAFGPNPSDPDIFLVNLAANPPNLISAINTGAGINAINAAGDFLYAANASSTEQLQIIDISDANNLYITASRTLAGVDAFGSFPQGRSVYYYNSQIYVGTAETAGPEFHVFDVKSPTNPIEIGSYELSHNVNDISVRGGVAYLATSADTGELIILDVSNPAVLEEIGSFNAGDSSIGDRDATRLFLLGDRIFLGRKRGTAANPEFYALRIEDASTTAMISKKHLNLASNTQVSGIFASGDFVIVTATDANRAIQFFNMSDEAQISEVSVSNSAEPATAVDFVNGKAFVNFMNFIKTLTPNAPN